jgi:hypothetical protein
MTSDHYVIKYSLYYVILCLMNVTWVTDVKVIEILRLF